MSMNMTGQAVLAALLGGAGKGLGTINEQNWQERMMQKKAEQDALAEAARATRAREGDVADTIRRMMPMYDIPLADTANATSYLAEQANHPADPLLQASMESPTWHAPMMPGLVDPALKGPANAMQADPLVNAFRSGRTAVEKASLKPRTGAGGKAKPTPFLTRAKDAANAIKALPIFKGSLKSVGPEHYDLMKSAMERDQGTSFSLEDARLLRQFLATSSVGAPQ